MISRDAHFALLVLLGSLAALVVARREAHHHPPRAAAAPLPPPLPAHGEGAQLRDGRGIDPNRAAAAELELLPGVGPSLARRIVAERSAHGPFQRVDDLRRVKGVGPKTLERLRPWLRIGSEQVEHAAQP